MPLIAESSYKPVWYLFQRHLETIVPSAFRKVHGDYKRTRLELSDGDFVDLDWIKSSGGSDNLVIISHGLEGNSTRHYSKGMASYFSQRGWDAVAWNCRSCSGELNRLARFYHHGDTADLASVVKEGVRLGYKNIVLIGFSMGGSFSLKYLGEQGKKLPNEVKGSVSFSVPCDLLTGGRILDSAGLTFYRNRFLGKLKKKLTEKSKLFPSDIDAAKLQSMSSFEDFNNCYTAPLHGFKDSEDFYSQASCKPYLKDIAVPSLLVNAANDPLLTPECYPVDIAKASKYLYLEIPQRGGHVGFAMRGLKQNWMEVRAWEFIESLLKG